METCSMCGRVIPSLVLMTTVVLLASPQLVTSQMVLPHDNINHWANEFGAIISGVVSRATGEVEIRSDYVLKHPKLETINGSQMVKEMKENMEEMLQKKVRALSSLVRVAEDAHANHEYNENIEVDYPNAKKLNVSEFLLEEDEHFNYIPVNLSKSTVHVPTNVYDQSEEVLNGVVWSEALDEYFDQNYKNDNTLTWQYFGSASGFFRNFPGAAWETEIYKKEHVDIYDSRSRGWYIQAATSPKDIVILLDASGSMKGLRMEIAKATVKKILETLSDDDFFNVIKFSKHPHYVDDCFNGTMVQANADNKKRVTEALNEVNTSDIAIFDEALIEAFDLLNMVNESGKGAQCNRAIMLITDGAPETYEEIFQRYNWPDKNVRVFPFLIGREVGDARQVKWMACSNKGYFSHISTLADVHEHVQTYINVISRPMVIDRANHTIWTSVYVDAADYVKVMGRPLVLWHPTFTIWTPVYMSADGGDDVGEHDREHVTSTGLQLMTSVAAPVYDTRNDTSSDGILLGVMGTDVPLKELTKLTPKSKLGVNGYAFAITNNGYVLFHPDFRPTEGSLIKPNYNSVDLAEVELQDSDVSEDIGDPDIATPNYEMQLRRRMVDREIGHLKMRVKIHYDDMKRITVRDQHYYFTTIDGTPFSLGIALPDGYGQYRVNGTIPLNKDTDLGAFTASKIKVARWNYCKMDTNETLQDPAIMLRTYLEYGKQGHELYKERCTKELIESILFDAVATRGALASWMKENRDGTSNGNTSKNFLFDNFNCTFDECFDDSITVRNGVELVFLGTKGGLTRYTTFTENLTDPYFIENNTNTVEEMYYVQAVEGGDKVFTFSIPFNAEQLYPNFTVTASTPIVHSENNHEAVAMVVGLQMRYEKFYEFFMNSTLHCKHEDKTKCNLTCFNDEIDCYLLDNNGYIVLSENYKDLGTFFGSKDAMLMMNLLYDKNVPEMKKGVFEKVQMFDYQGVCQIWPSGDSGASALFINPIMQLTSIFWWFIGQVTWFLFHFNFAALLPGTHWTVTDSAKSFIYTYIGNEMDYPDSSSSSTSQQDGQVCVSEIFDRLSELGSESQTYQYRNELIQQSSVDYANCEELNIWFKRIYDQHKLKQTKSDEPCVKEYMHFFAKWENLPKNGTQQDACQNCNRSYSVSRVTGTNLILLVVDAVCNCNANPTPIEPVEVKYNETMMCRRLQTEIYRKRPSACYASHKDENSKHCGKASFVQPSTQLLMTSLLLILAAKHH